MVLPRGALRVTQGVFLLGGRRLALLSTLIEARAPLASKLIARLSLPPSVAAEPLAHCRGFRLTAPAHRQSAQVLPIGLPSLAYETERGEFVAADGALALGQRPTGRRWWLPLLVSWDSARNRRPAAWRILTVSERGKAVGPDRAVAVRVSWGRRETYVIYRSLTGPARAHSWATAPCAVPVRAVHAGWQCHADRSD